jgi:hypothetical protein
MGRVSGQLRSAVYVMRARINNRAKAKGEYVMFASVE